MPHFIIKTSRRQENPRQIALPGINLWILVQALLAVTLQVQSVNADGAGCVTGDVDDGTAHIQDTVDTGDQCDALQGQADGLQNHGQHDDAGTGNTGGADGSQGGGQDDGQLLGQSQIDAEDLGDEDGADALVDGGAVHVDGCAQGQDEACDLLTDAQLLGGLHVEGQGAHGACAGEGEDHCLTHALEELDRAHASHQTDGGGVDHDHVDDVGDVSDQDDLQQGQQNSGAVLSDDGADQSEDADGGQLDDHAHDLEGDLSKAVDDLVSHLALLTGQDDAEAQEQGDDDDLQHGSLHQGLECVGGEDVDDGVDEAGSLGSGVAQLISGQDEACADVQQVSEQQAEGDGQGGGAHVVDHGTQADGADLANILQGDDALGDGQQHHGNDDHLDQVQVDGAEGLDVFHGDVGVVLQQDAGQNTQDQTNGNLNSQ